MKPLYLALSLTLALTGALSAQVTQIQTKNFGPSTPDFSTLLTFDKYAGDLSHIIDIQVTWAMSISDGFLIIDNDGLSPATGSYDFGADLSLNAGNTTVTLTDTSFQPIFSNTEVTNSGTFNLAGNIGDGGGDFDPTGPDGITINGGGESSNGGGSINSLFHAQYVSGLGGTAGSTFDIAFDTNEFLNLTTGGAVESLLSSVSAFGSVTVTYTLIPEPSTGLMSLIGTTFLLRRRSRA